MTELVITRGLPASGKTTLAREWVANGPNRARVNRDEIRFNLFGAYFGVDEEAVTRAQRGAVRSLLTVGYSVIVDDTHLQARWAKPWLELAQSTGVGFELIDVPTPMDECIRRDDARAARGERAVTEDVIRKMARRAQPYTLETTAPPSIYEPDLTLPPAWLVDADGTLALMQGRGPFEWHRVGEDLPNPAVVRMVRALALSAEIIVMSGRDGVCRPETETWLQQHDVPCHRLIMRTAGDKRPDALIKYELFSTEVAPFYNVLGVLDDRDRVVAMWRSIGLTCAQVAPGDF